MPFRQLAKWLRWSNTRQAWQERCGVLATITGALLLWFFADAVPAWQQVLGWASLALLVAGFTRRGWVKLLGPVLFYDLVRQGRRTRYFAYRITYLGILFFLLCWIYFSWAERSGWNQPLTRSRAAELTLLFFITFMCVQMLCIVVLTPAFTAGAIAEEKERKTLEFILATDLRNREIVFGKLLSRMAFLSMFILAGLPVLSALQFLGGFSPRGLLAGFAATMLTMVSLASLSLLMSVLARRTRDALFLVYLILIGYLAVTVIANIQLNVGNGNSFPSTAFWESPLTLEDVLLAVRAGNPIFTMSGLILPGGLDENGIGRALASYAWFHGLVTVVCAGASVGLLRRASLKEPLVSRPSVLRRRWRPVIGQWPMIWKEVWLERLVKRRWLVVGGTLVLVLLSFVPVAIMLAEYLSLHSTVRNYYGNPWDVLGEKANSWVRSVGMLVALLGLAGVGVRAATSVRGEHDKDTMTSLLTTTLSSEEILFGKWLGSITSMRWFAVWLGLIWIVGVLCNGLSPVAVPLLATACLCYAAAAASLGLWCSVVSRSSMHAILATLGIGVLLFAAHWVPWMCCIPVVNHLEKDTEFVVQIQGAVTPPVVLAGYLPHSPSDLEHGMYDIWNPVWLMFLGLSGAGVWGLLAFGVWNVANHHFKASGGRLDSVSPTKYVPTAANQLHYLPSETDGCRVLPGDYEHTERLQTDRTDGRVVENTDSTG